MFLPLLAVKIDIHSDETFDITYFYARSDTFFYAEALKYTNKYYRPQIHLTEVVIEIF